MEDIIKNIIENNTQESNNNLPIEVKSFMKK